MILKRIVSPESTANLTVSAKYQTPKPFLFHRNQNPFQICNKEDSTKHQAPTFAGAAVEVAGLAVDGVGIGHIRSCASEKRLPQHTYWVSVEPFPCSRNHK